MNKNFKSKLLPLSLALFVIILDQITKTLIVKNIPLNTIGAEFFGDFLRIIHVSNTGVAFSVGAAWSDIVRFAAVVIVPLVVIVLVFIVYFRNNEWTTLQRWAIMGIVGGGIGNLIDRAFRAEGVVDFIDVKFFGIFGLDRWPTFNVADSSIIICGILLAITFIISIKKEKSTEKSKENN